MLNKPSLLADRTVRNSSAHASTYSGKSAMQCRLWFALGICVLSAFASGCVCCSGGACGTPLAGCQQPVCDSGCNDDGCSSSACGVSDCSNFYSGQGPLARFFGVTQCAGGGCGEVYVDEWINEPPTDDHCGYGQCLNCGRAPIRSLFHAILGEQYYGGCDTCNSDFAGGADHQTVIDGGYGEAGVSMGRSCNCGGSHANHPATISNAPSSIGSPARIESTNPQVDPSAVPSPPIPGESIMDGNINRGNSGSGANGPAGGGSSSPAGIRETPTPAPKLNPSSAYRLNPATRRVVR